MQAHLTIGPQPQLVDEFMSETGQQFWMYSVDQFIQRSAEAARKEVDKAVIAEIIETRRETKAETEAAERAEAQRDAAGYSKRLRPVLSEDELYAALCEFLSSHPSEDRSVALKYFVVGYLGSQEYEINHSYARLNVLAQQGRIEMFQKQRDGYNVTFVRLPKPPLPPAPDPLTFAA